MPKNLCDIRESCLISNQMGNHYQANPVLFIITIILAAGLLIWGLTYLLNWISYQYLKRRVLRRRHWDLNICCGNTDGGGLNADIKSHNGVPNFCRIDDIYHLPFADQEFAHVLCSHTIEHVERPAEFYRELQRVGQRVTLKIPPLWDISAALNVLEHKWLFLTFRTEHDQLPRYMRLPLARLVQKIIGGQRIKA